MRYKTRFGDLDVEDKQIIIFDNGLPGFSNLRKFILLARENDYPIHWLVSLENEFVAFPIVNPWLICVDYTINLSDLDIRELGIESQSDLNIWAIMTIPKDDPTQATVNLLAPVVINLKNGRAKQIIQEDSDYSVRHLVKDELERSKKIIEKSKTGSG